MRKVTYGGATSLDNFLARADHAVDWLMWSDEAGAIMQEYWSTIDTILMGRKTYEIAARNNPGGDNEGMPGIHTYVFSRTLKNVPGPGATLIASDAAAFVKDLKQKPGKGICVMGGGELAHSLFEADLIDEVGFNIHPVLLGLGIPAFHKMTRQIDLELAECKPFKNGCVYVLYRVKHRPA